MPNLILPPGVRSSDPDDPREDLDFALQHCPEALQCARVQDLAEGWSRAPRDRHGRALGSGRGGVKLSLPDEIVRNQRGPEDDRDLIILIKIPAAVRKQRRSRVYLGR